MIIYYLAIALIYLAYHTISSPCPSGCCPSCPSCPSCPTGCTKGEVIVYPQPYIVRHPLYLVRQQAAIAAQQELVARSQEMVALRRRQNYDRNRMVPHEYALRKVEDDEEVR